MSMGMGETSNLSQLLVARVGRQDTKGEYGCGRDVNPEPAAGGEGGRQDRMGEYGCAGDINPEPAAVGGGRWTEGMPRIALKMEKDRMESSMERRPSMTIADGKGSRQDGGGGGQGAEVCFEAEGGGQDGNGG
eukprot:1161383-Pelagomonas_calceolata.AAC.3